MHELSERASKGLSQSQLDMLFLAFKAALACLVALTIDRFVITRVLDAPDGVTSCFVAVLTITPVTLLGLRQATSQMVGSALGGVWGMAAVSLGLAPMWGVPAAVGMAILSAHLLRAQDGYPVAAFTALYFVLVPLATPMLNFETRLLGVASGSIAGFTINSVVSAMAYRSIFAGRLREIEQRVRAVLPVAAREGPDAAEAEFAALASHQSELVAALEELRWRRAWDTRTEVERMWLRVEQLRVLLHLCTNFGYVANEAGLDASETEAFVSWLARAEGDPPAVPEPLRDDAERIAAVAARLREGTAQGRRLWT